MITDRGISIYLNNDLLRPGAFLRESNDVHRNISIKYINWKLFTPNEHILSLIRYQNIFVDHHKYLGEPSEISVKYKSYEGGRVYDHLVRWNIDDDEIYDDSPNNTFIKMMKGLW